jgi:hypothetical protein
MKNLGDLNNWTKNDLARVIVQALYTADKPVAADHFQVKAAMKRKKSDLVYHAQNAINILDRAAMAKI